MERDDKKRSRPCTRPPCSTMVAWIVRGVGGILCRPESARDKGQKVNCCTSHNLSERLYLIVTNPHAGEHVHEHTYLDICMCALNCYESLKHFRDFMCGINNKGGIFKSPFLPTGCFLRNLKLIIL